MRALPLSLVLLLLLPSIALARKQVHFSYRSPSAGDQVVSKDSLAMSFDVEIRMNGRSSGKISARRDQLEELTWTLGEGWGPEAKQATLRYGGHEVSEHGVGPDGGVEDSRTVAPVAGKTYSIRWAKGTEPVVLSAEGGVPPADELSQIIEDWAQISRDAPDAFQRGLAGKKLALGAPIESELAVIAALIDLDEDDGLLLDSAKVVFKKIRRVDGERCAVFALDLRLVGQEQMMSMSMSAEGEAVLSIDGLRIHSLKMEGPLRIDVQGEQGGLSMSMTGEGTLSGLREIRYPKR